MPLRRPDPPHTRENRNHDESSESSPIAFDKHELHQQQTWLCGCFRGLRKLACTRITQDGCGIWEETGRYIRARGLDYAIMGLGFTVLMLPGLSCSGIQH